MPLLHPSRKTAQKAPAVPRALKIVPRQRSNLSRRRDRGWRSQVSGFRPRSVFLLSCFPDSNSGPSRFSWFPGFQINLPAPIPLQRSEVGGQRSGRSSTLLRDSRRSPGFAAPAISHRFPRAPFDVDVCSLPSAFLVFWLPNLIFRLPSPSFPPFQLSAFQPLSFSRITPLMARSILAVIVGPRRRLCHRPPHRNRLGHWLLPMPPRHGCHQPRIHGDRHPQPPGPINLAAILVAWAIGSFVGGWVAAWIARAHQTRCAIIVAVLIISAASRTCS